MLKRSGKIPTSREKRKISQGEQESPLTLNGCPHHLTRLHQIAPCRYTPDVGIGNKCHLYIVGKEFLLLERTVKKAVSDRARGGCKKRPVSDRPLVSELTH